MTCKVKHSGRGYGHDSVPILPQTVIYPHDENEPRGRLVYEKSRAVNAVQKRGLHLNTCAEPDTQFGGACVKSSAHVLYTEEGGMESGIL